MPRYYTDADHTHKRLSSVSSQVYGALILSGDYGARAEWVAEEICEEPRAVRSHLSVLVTEGLAESLGRGSGKWRAMIPARKQLPR